MCGSTSRTAWTLVDWAAGQDRRGTAEASAGKFYSTVPTRTNMMRYVCVEMRHVSATRRRTTASQRCITCRVIIGGEAAGSRCTVC